MVFINTLIELFDIKQIDNVIAPLHYHPEKIVYIGSADVMTEELKLDVSNFFCMHGLTAYVEFVEVDKNDISDIINKTNKVIDNNPDVYIDVTGGKELILVAMGIIAAKRNIPMIKFNVKTGEVINVNNSALPSPRPVNVTGEELISLYGGMISHSEPDSFNWVFSEEFYKDILSIWEICSYNNMEWNRQCNRFQSYISSSYAHTDGLTVEIDFRYVKNKKEVYNESIINALLRKGLITDFSQIKNKISFKYKNRQIQKCLLKAGNALELYTFLNIGKIISENPGKISYAKVGVHIDWNGETYTPYDVKNEVDIMVISNLIPTYISCKNGDVYKEDLYELSAVADNFGGIYSKKILVATSIPENVASGKYLLERSKEMGINVINNVDKKSEEEFINELKTFLNIQ